ncbi:hypothetical protein ACPFUR_003440 [Vibrio cholerae]
MNLLNRILVFASVICLFLVFKTSDEPTILRGGLSELAFEQFSFGNTILFNFSSGLLISIWFYFLVVYIPDVRRRNRVKKHFVMQYSQFRKQVITHILGACKENYDAGLPKTLITPSEFNTYFSVKVQPNRTRWYVFMNNADATVVKNILAEFIAFKEAILYLLSKVDIEDEELHAFLHNFNTITTTLVNTHADDYDSMKVFSSYLREIFTGFSWISGSNDYDHFGRIFDKL